MNKFNTFFLLGIAVIGLIFVSTLLMGYAFGNTAAALTMIATSWIGMWYMVRGMVKHYYVSKHGQEGWTPERRKIMNLLVVAGSLNIFVFFWFIAAKKDFPADLGFAWK